MLISLFLSFFPFKSPPFTSSYKTRNAHDTESKQRSLRLSLFFFSLRSYLFSVFSSLSVLAEQTKQHHGCRGITKEDDEEEEAHEKLLCSVFSFSWFTLSTRTRKHTHWMIDRERRWSERDRDRDSERAIAQTRTFSWYLWIITTQWRNGIR